MLESALIRRDAATVEWVMRANPLRMGHRASAVASEPEWVHEMVCERQAVLLKDDVAMHHEGGGGQVLN